MTFFWLSLVNVSVSVPASYYAGERDGDVLFGQDLVQKKIDADTARHLGGH